MKRNYELKRRLRHDERPLNDIQSQHNRMEVNISTNWRTYILTSRPTMYIFCIRMFKVWLQCRFQMRSCYYRSLIIIFIISCLRLLCHCDRSFRYDHRFIPILILSNLVSHSKSSCPEKILQVQRAHIRWNREFKMFLKAYNIQEWITVEYLYTVTKR
jgi:hypothetical protein